MVLRRGERNRGLAVAEREERGFLALEKLLHHQLGAGLAQPAAEHHVDRGLRLGDAFRHHHALAGGEPVGLDDDRRALRAHIVLRRRRRGEPLVGGGRDVVRPAQVLGEALGAFEAGGGLARAERLDAGGREIIDDAGAERRLRPDHDQIDRMRLAERDHRRVVGDVERHDLALLGDAGIAGRAIEPLGERARGDLPGERMLAPAGAEEEDVHECATGPQAGMAAGGVAWRNGPARERRKRAVNWRTA